MDNQKIIILVVLVVGLAIGGDFLFGRKKEEKDAITPTSNPNFDYQTGAMQNQSMGIYEKQQIAAQTDTVQAAKQEKIAQGYRYIMLPEGLMVEISPADSKKGAELFGQFEAAVGKTQAGAFNKNSAKNLAAITRNQAISFWANFQPHKKGKYTTIAEALQFQRWDYGLTGKAKILAQNQQAEFRSKFPTDTIFMKYPVG